MEPKQEVTSPEKLMILYDNEVEEVSERFAAVYWKNGSATIAGNLKSSDSTQLLKTLWGLALLQENIVKVLIKKG